MWGKKRDVELLSKVQEAIKNNEFQLYLQPKFDVKSRSVKSCEALVRWIHQGEEILPCEFIELFEHTGWIQRIDQIMIELACKQLKEWRLQGIQNTIAVNISKGHLVGVGFVDSLINNIKRYGISTKDLEIEITESLLIEEEKMSAVVDLLIQEKFKVAIDDFGSGFSCLHMLSYLKVDTVKLDQAFFTHNKEQGRVLVKGLIAMLKGLGVEIVAEGAKAEDINFLMNEGVDLIQSYYYSKAVPASEFLDCVEQINNKYSIL